MDKLAKLIGKRVREIRQRKGLRQEDMENYKMSYRYYQKIEAGKANLTLATIEKLASVFEIDPTELFTFPLSSSPEANELANKISAIIREDDEDTIRKLLVVIDEVI